MKLQPDKSSAPLVRAYTEHWLQIDDRRFERSVIVSSLPEHPTQSWEPALFADLQTQHMQALTGLGADLVILGTGRQLKMAPPAWRALFATRRIGLETMDTAAACRTYNILASEGRKVVAALLLEPGAGGQPEYQASGVSS